MPAESIEFSSGREGIYKKDKGEKTKGGEESEVGAFLRVLYRERKEAKEVDD